MTKESVQDPELEQGAGRRFRSAAIPKDKYYQNFTLRRAGSEVSNLWSFMIQA